MNVERLIVDSILETYWGGVASRLQAEADVFNSLSGHNGEVGRSNELSLANLVTRLLPSTIGVGTGVILDSKGARSHQTDLIAFNSGNQPQLLAQTEQVLFPIETALLAVEVKTTLTTAEVRDAGRKCGHLRKMHTPGDKVHFSIFAYQCGDSAIGVAEAVHALPTNEKPDAICVLRPGMFGASEGGKFSLGFVPLHERLNDGVRVSNTWELDGSKSVPHGMFPTVRTEKRGRTKIVTEPGRALLMYCNALLGALESRGQVDADWLQTYIPAIAKERLLIPSASS
jgi:hypothetical protein